MVTNLKENYLAVYLKSHQHPCVLANRYTGLSFVAYRLVLVFQLCEICMVRISSASLASSSTIARPALPSPFA